MKTFPHNAQNPRQSVLAVDPVVLPDGPVPQQSGGRLGAVAQHRGEDLLAVAARRPHRPGVLQRAVVVADPRGLPGPGHGGFELGLNLRLSFSVANCPN